MDEIRAHGDRHSLQGVDAKGGVPCEEERDGED